MKGTLLLMGACVAILFVTDAGAATPAELGGGKEWLAWTPAERNV